MRLVLLLLTVILRVAHRALCVWVFFISASAPESGLVEVVMMSAKSRASARSTPSRQPGCAASEEWGARERTRAEAQQ